MLLVSVLAYPGLVRAAGWWSPQWQYRREVDVGKVAASGHAGAEVAVVEFGTGGHVRADGADIRVVGPDNREIPARVLMLGPGDRAKVAFEARPNVGTVWVYFGNAKAPARTKELEIRRGVLLETWESPGGAVRSLADVQAVFKKTRTLLGRGFRDRVFLGHNPFGPQNQIASRFTAFFHAKIAGQYTFATASQDASFLLIDGRPVVANGGYHRPQRRVSRQGKAQLTRGLHELTFLHVCANGNPVAVVAWQPPGQKRIRPMAPSAFTSVFTAQAGPVRQYGRPISVDFTAEHAGEAFFKNRYTQRYVFQARLLGRVPRGARLTWDFGDGQSATGPKVEHVYLLPGEHTVKLTARTGLGELSWSEKVFVSRPWDRVHVNELDATADHAKIVSGYDFGKLAPAALAEAVLLCERGRQPDAARRAGKALLGTGRRGDRATREALAVTIELLESAGQAEAAIEALTAAAKRFRGVAARAQLLVWAGQVALRSGEAEQARTMFQTVLDKVAPVSTHPTVREARVGLGDAYRLAGDADKARKAYEQAGLGGDITAMKLPVARGHFARQVEDFTRRGELEAAAEQLERWALAIPADKLEGFWSLLACRLMVARKQYAPAVREAMTLVKVAPASNHAPSVLMLAAQAQRTMGEPAAAEATLRRIVSDYPESQLAAEAAEQLKER